MKEGIFLAKQKLQVYIDLEHRDALEELKTYLPVDDRIKDSAMIRYVLLDLLNRVRKEENFEKKVLDSLSVLEIMTNAKLEQDHTEIRDIFSSNVYQDALTMNKKVVRNKNYRFKNRPKELKKQEAKQDIPQQEPPKKERDIQDIIAQYMHEPSK